MAWRALVTVGVAALLATVDLLHKTTSVTPHWGYHMRSGAWLALTTAVVVACLLLVRVPSWGIAAAAGVLAGGAAGNALSAVGSTEGVPNPIIVVRPNVVIAFNLADVFTVVGILLLTSLLVVVTIEHRARLEATRAAWRNALRRPR